MAFIPSSRLSSFDVGGPVIPGTIKPVSAGSFASRAALFAAQRYGPRLVGAAVSRMDSSVNNLADKISGSDISSNNNSNNRKGRTRSGSKPNSDFKNRDDGNGQSPPPRGGRRARRNPNGSSSVGSSVNVNGVPRFTIDTGIPSGTLLNPMQKTTKYYSPLFVQCGRLFSNITDQDDSFFSSLINSELYFKYKIIVQSVITNSFTRYFTEANFYNYIGLVSYSLQVYYMVDSILAYTSVNTNTNIGMMKLRMAITPEIVNYHIKLKEYLESIPIPPNLLEYIRYLYQNFTFNDVEGSSIIRLSVDDLLCTSEYNGELGLNSEVYNSIFHDIIDSSETLSIMKRIRENWVNQLPASSYESFYDPQFSTFWHNSNVSYEDFGSNMVKYTINAKSFEDLLYYGIFDNRLDGIIYASCSVNIKYNNKDVQQMGIWQPFNEFAERNSINSSLLHYSNDNFIRPVTEVEFRNASMVHSAPHVVITQDNNPMWEVNASNFAGSTVPQVHTLENTTQAVVKSVEWLLSPN
jgi:hypothetical protein